MMNVNTYPSCRILFVKYVNIDLSCKNIVGRLYPVAWNPTIDINANPHGARDYNVFQFCDIAIVTTIAKRKQPKLARHQRAQYTFPRILLSFGDFQEPNVYIW